MVNSFDLEVPELERLLAANKANTGNRATVCDPSTMKTLKGTLKDATTGAGGFLAENGMMNGYPVIGTTNCPSNTMIHANWNELIVATWGFLALARDDYSEFSKGNVGIRGIWPVDFNVRHALSFVKSTAS